MAGVVGGLKRCFGKYRVAYGFRDLSGALLGEPGQTSNRFRMGG